MPAASRPSRPRRRPIVLDYNVGPPGPILLIARTGPNRQGLQGEPLEKAVAEALAVILKVQGIDRLGSVRKPLARPEQDSCAARGSVQASSTLAGSHSEGMR